jgi:hypothetical protein
MALSHHDAAQSDERRSGEPEFLGTKTRSDDDISTSLKLSICLQLDARPQIVDDQSLLRLSEPQLPWKTRSLDSSPCSSSRASITTRYSDL